MGEDLDSAIEAFAAACQRAATMRLVRCSSGNLSQRLDESRMLIKASRGWMGDLDADQVAVCRIADGVSLNGRKPSVEIGFHAGILRARPEVNVVLHCQTPFATTLACCARAGTSFAVIPEIPYYIGEIGEVPFLLPGSRALAEAVVAVMQDHDLALLRNHGQVTVGPDFERTFQNAVFFEVACEIIVRAGARVQPIPPDMAREVLAARHRHDGAA